MFKMKCFFCDIQNKEDSQRFAENKLFFARFDDFPVSKGHCEIIPKAHIISFFDLTGEQVLSLYELLEKIKEILGEKFNPDGYNVGINEGKAAGRTQDHLHVQIIPRYEGDVENPRGGIRNIIPNKGDYKKEMKERFPERQDYFPE